MRIAIVSLRPLRSDARVLRSARTLSEAGHDVLVVAHGPGPDEASFRMELVPSSSSPLAIRAGLLLRHAPATLWHGSARATYWLDPSRRRAAELVKFFRPDAVLANDWDALPIAAVAKAVCGSSMIYDSHEMAIAEHEDRLTWRLLMRGHVRAVEARWIREADAVITVSRGIADALVSEYALDQCPFLVRNIPHVSPQPFRAPGRSLRVLFHGLLRPNRGLEPLIDSVPLWRPELSLVLRGTGADSYLASLRARIRALQVDDRISLEPAVPLAEVIARAAEADVGAMLLPDTSRHNSFALPNKLFEYVAAGLGIVVTPLPDVERTFGPFGCCVFVRPEPGSVAHALNSLTPEKVSDLKRAANAAAAELTWSRERETLLAIFDAIALRRRNDRVR